MNGNLLYLYLTLTLFALSCFSEALCRPIRIKKITKASQFERRQSPRVELKAIHLEPFDLVGKPNVAAASASLKKSLERVKIEIEEQENLLEDYEQRVKTMVEHIEVLKKDRDEVMAREKAIRTEIKVLRGINSPTRPILDCISELEGDLAQVNQQLDNIKRAIEVLNSRIDFVKRVGETSAKNLSRLERSHSFIAKGREALESLEVPKTPNKWRKKLSLPR